MLTVIVTTLSVVQLFLFQDKSASDMNSQDSSDSSEVEEEAQTSFKQNLIDSSTNIPAALQVHVIQHNSSKLSSLVTYKLVNTKMKNSNTVGPR